MRESDPEGQSSRRWPLGPCAPAPRTSSGGASGSARRPCRGRGPGSRGRARRDRQRVGSEDLRRPHPSEAPVAQTGGALECLLEWSVDVHVRWRCPSGPPQPTDSVTVVSIESQPTGPVSVGVVGAGQLARMMGEAAREANVTLTVLASSPDDAAVATRRRRDPSARRTTSARSMNSPRLVDVVTFDHELVDLDQIAALEARGVVVRPDARALRFAVDKGHQRRAFDAAGMPVPRFIVVASSARSDAEGLPRQRRARRS